MCFRRSFAGIFADLESTRLHFLMLGSRCAAASCLASGGGCFIKRWSQSDRPCGCGSSEALDVRVNHANAPLTAVQALAASPRQHAAANERRHERGQSTATATLRNLQTGSEAQWEDGATRSVQEVSGCSNPPTTSWSIATATSSRRK